MIISVEAADGPGNGLTLDEVEELCRQARAAGGHGGNRVTGLTRGFKGRQFRMSVDTMSGTRSGDEKREN